MVKILLLLSEMLQELLSAQNMPAKSLELKHTIKLIQELDSEIDEIENRDQTHHG